MNKDRGFTLPEIMIATVVLVIACIGLLGLYVNCMAFSERARNLIIATNHLNYVMEEIASRPHSDMVDVRNGDDTWWTTWWAQELASWTNEETIDNKWLVLGNEALTVSASDHGGLGDPNILDITVNISWTQRNNENMQRALSTIMVN